MLDVSNVNSLFTHIYVGTKEMSLLYRNLKKKMSEDLGNSLDGCWVIQKNLAKFGYGLKIKDALLGSNDYILLKIT